MSVVLGIQFSDKPRVYYLFLEALEDAILHLIEGNVLIDEQSNEIGPSESRDHDQISE